MTWEKGKSGNPGGLTLRQSRTKRLIEGLGPVAVARLEQLLRSDNETVALGAAKEVLARVAPIPKQAKIDVNVEHGPNAHLAALISLARKSPISGHALPNETQTPMLDITPSLGHDGHNGHDNPLGVLQSQTEQVIADLVDDDEDEPDDP
jgi:hypothetical protein